MRLEGDRSVRCRKVTDWLDLIYSLVHISTERFILNVLNLYVDKLWVMFSWCCHSCVRKLDRKVGLVFYLELARVRQIFQVEFDWAVSLGWIESCLCGLRQFKLTRCNMTLVITLWPDIDSGAIVLDTTILKAIVSGVRALLDLHYVLGAWLHLQRGYWISDETIMLIDLICMLRGTCLSSVRCVVVITLIYVEIEIFWHCR